MDTKTVGHPRDIASRVDLSHVRTDKELDSKKKSISNRINEKDFQIELSPEAKEMAKSRQKALEIAKATSPEREDKIADLQGKIKNGQYQLDSGKIADGMLREAIRDELSKDSSELF